MSKLRGLAPRPRCKHLERLTAVFRVAGGEIHVAFSWKGDNDLRNLCQDAGVCSLNVAEHLFLWIFMDPPVKTAAVRGQRKDEALCKSLRVSGKHANCRGKRARRLSFPLSRPLQKYWNEVNQLISPPLTDPLPWPRTALSAIRKAGRIDLMGYYWAHNEARQQWWQVLKTLNTPSVISILTEDLLKSYNTKMCNPAQTQWHSLVGSGVKVFFCDPSPPGLFRQMMEGWSQRSTPRPTSHSPHVLRLPRQHAWAWHFSRGAFIVRNLTPANIFAYEAEAC